MFENPRRGGRARHFTTNVPKILALKSSFEQIFSENCRGCPCPIKIERVRSGKVPWITSDLRKGIRDRDVAKRKAIKSNFPQDWAMYKRLRNRINGEVKSTKAFYYASAFIHFNGDSRKTWQLINELTSRQKNNASVKELKLNENSVTNSHELSNAFNDHFSAIGTKLAN